MSPKNLFENQAILKVIGVGGGGCNAVNRMVEAGLTGVEFVAMNTDRQALDLSLADTTLQLGVASTRGLGVGGDPARGEAAAKESEKAIQEMMEKTDMVFITAGMGGGTGTGAAPIVAEIARRNNVLTVGVVTKPFLFEGPKRHKAAMAGLERLRNSVDTLIVIPNDKLLGVVEKRTSLTGAFVFCDDVLRQGVQGISDIILKPGLINVDFADVRAVMSNAGVALMGLGAGKGEQRAKSAAEAAANSPLLETSIQGAKKILVNITAGPGFTIGEAYDAMEYIVSLSDADEAEIFMGHVTDESADDQVWITLIAAGMDGKATAVDQELYHAETTRRREPQPAQSIQTEEVVATARRRTPGQATPVEEIDLDIPAFLRRQREGN